MTRTIGEWILYYKERYGQIYVIRIETPGMDSRVYYWWDGIPRELLEKPAKSVWCRNRKDAHGDYYRELEIVY